MGDLPLRGLLNQAQHLLRGVNDVFGGLARLICPGRGDIPRWRRPVLANEFQFLRSSYMLLTSATAGVRVNTFKQQWVPMLKKRNLLDRRIRLLE